MRPACCRSQQLTTLLPPTGVYSKSDSSSIKMAFQRWPFEAVPLLEPWPVSCWLSGMTAATAAAWSENKRLKESQKISILLLNLMQPNHSHLQRALIRPVVAFQSPRGAIGNIEMMRNWKQYRGTVIKVVDGLKPSFQMIGIMSSSQTVNDGHYQADKMIK